MVTLKSSRAMDSFLGLGTHIWIEVVSESGEKNTFSGYKSNKLLGIKENQQRDYDRESTRGSAIVTPPANMSQQQWDEQIIDSGRSILKQFDKTLLFNGINPCGKNSGNCCTIARAIITRAGGEMPKCKFKGFSPGLEGILHFCD